MLFVVPNAPPKVASEKMTESIKPRFVFIPGAGGMAWYWGRVVDLLAARQYEAIPVDLPAFAATDGAIEKSR